MKRGSWKTILKIIIAYIALTYLSSGIFMLIEYDGLKDMKSPKDGNLTLIKVITEERLQVTKNHSEVEKIIAVVSDEVKRLDSFKKSEWKRKIEWRTFFRWLYFARISAATIGFGDIVPETDGGKLFLIPFAIAAIPTQMLLVTHLGMLISDAFNMLDAFISRKIFRKPKRPNPHIVGFVMLIFVSVIWITFTGVMGKWKAGWRLLDGIYASFVAYTTIGYGDFVFGDIGLLGNEVISWAATIGLTLLAGIIDMILKIMSTTAVSASPKDENKLDLEKAVVG